ncbi:MAG TPA: hypothetical protein VNW29_02235 [Candidatus Sulfotelmatobacter sp.]|jgi:hypothetical protein|nr:hypothetical protein [Candidatus Sulfotelmatobacter sp.]
MLGISSIKSFFIPPQRTTYQEENSSIDIILYALSLSSNQLAILPYQERLREITARIKPEEKKLSLENQLDLVDLYTNVETFLIEKEPLKKITRAELRKKIVEKFNLQAHIDNTSFWNKLPQ